MKTLTLDGLRQFVEETKELPGQTSVRIELPTDSYTKDGELFPENFWQFDATVARIDETPENDDFDYEEYVVISTSNPEVVKMLYPDHTPEKIS